MEFDEIVVKESPGLCRCCLSEGCYKDMGTEYSWMNENEVYADMLLECFDISISQHNEGPNGPNRLICEVCITRLRDACYFKKQVQETEKKFIDMVARGEFRPKVLIYQTQMKTELEMPAEDAEVEYLEDEMDFGDDEPLRKSEAEPLASVSEVTADPLPIKGKRGRPKKAEKTEKKKVKLEPKAKTSKALVKDDQLSREDIDKQSNYEMTRVLTVIIENSTVMPFRWCSNKYMCFYCFCPFDEVTKLKQHTKTEHEEPKLKNILSLACSRRIKLDVSELSCKKCRTIMHSLEDFLEHAISVHGIKFNKELGKSLFSFNLGDGDLTCLECSQTFKFFGSLLIHTYRFHNKSNSFVCEICGRAFVTKANVNNHVRMIHKQVECDECHKIFTTQHMFMKHFEKEHAVGRLKCPKCPVILGSRYLKKRHMALVHDGKVHKCDECAKVFTFKGKLLEHKARVHLKEKAATCAVCGFQAFNKEMLRRHMVRHDDARPFECDICKKTFQRKKTMELHKRIHTNDRRYACKDCGKAFVQVASLKLHIRVHHSIMESTS